MKNEVDIDHTPLAKLGVLDQLAVAAQPRHRLALAAGAVLGGLVPIASYVIAHFEVSAAPLKWIFVAAGMLYSALSVFEWSRAAFRSAPKALGFVTLIEGVALFASTLPISLCALAVLIIINAASTGCNLIADRRAARRAGAVPPRKTAPRRRAETHARTTTTALPSRRHARSRSLTPELTTA